MTPEANDDTQVSRRRFLQGIGVAGVAATTPWLRSGQAGAQSGPELLPQPAVAGAPSPEQLHLQFGSDAAREVSASWSTPVRVSRPRLRLGRPGRGLGTEVDAEERTTEALTGQTIFTYHASVDGLEPDTSYLYEVFHRGADAVGGRLPARRDGRKRSASRASATSRCLCPSGRASVPGPRTPATSWTLSRPPTRCSTC